MNSCLPPPVLLNGWKHHLGFVCKMVIKFDCEVPVIAKAISKNINYARQLYAGLDDVCRKI